MDLTVLVIEKLFVDAVTGMYYFAIKTCFVFSVKMCNVYSPICPKYCTNRYEESGCGNRYVYRDEFFINFPFALKISYLLSSETFVECLCIGQKFG